ERRRFSRTNVHVGHIGSIPVLADLHVVHPWAELHDQALVRSGVFPRFAVDRDAGFTWLYSKRKGTELRSRRSIRILIGIRCGIPISRTDRRLTLRRTRRRWTGRSWLSHRGGRFRVPRAARVHRVAA